MGWVWKTLGFVLALILIGAGAWLFGLLILAVLFVPTFLRAWKKRPASQGKESSGRGFPRRHLLAGLLFLAAILGLIFNGSFSPFVFGGLGLLVMAWGRLPISATRSRVKPVEESILLRSPLSVSWAAVAEVKLLTRDLGRALAGVTGRVLIMASEAPSIYLAVERRAWTERSAEDEILAALRETAFALAPLGAYLLPLDSEQASALLQPTLGEIRPVADWSTALASGAYDVVSISQERGFAMSLGLFRRVDQDSEGRGKIPVSSEQFAHPPFLAEVFKVVGGRLAWPHPDQYTAFLSSLLATSGEPVGTRIIDAGEGSQSQLVQVRSQGSPPVELSRAQLRAVVRIYERGPR